MLTGLQPQNPAWKSAQHDAAELAGECAPVLGFRPNIRLVSMPPAGLGQKWAPDAGPEGFAASSSHGLLPQLSELASQGCGELFLLPASLEFGLWDRQSVAEAGAVLRRETAGTAVYHDDVDPGHAMVAQAFGDQALRALGSAHPREPLRILLVARGDGDAASRAQCYRMMRLLWEQLDAAGGEVAFLRNANPFARESLERLTSGGQQVVVVPFFQWNGEQLDHLRVIVGDHCRTHPESTDRCFLAEPPGAHPCLRAWMRQRLLALWSECRRRAERREFSAKRQQSAAPRRLGAGLHSGIVAEVRNAAGLRALLPEPILDAARVFVKVTWHGYAPGTYTDATALDALLTAIPGRVTLLEGHTSSRNLAPPDWDWETEAEKNRRWIREQEAEYFRRTGLSAVIERHKAQYVNVTECFWNGECAPESTVRSRLGKAAVALRDPRLTAFVPAALLDHAAAPLISFARFKGPTRLSLSNLFGLIPDPLRSGWHGPNITYFAQVCCDLARLYGTWFRLYGLVEGLHTAVRWDRRGLYRSRWGNYDLIPNPGLAVLSEGVAAADVLASRLQGQDVRRSAFFDVVARELGIHEESRAGALPESWLRRLA